MSADAGLAAGAFLAASRERMADLYARGGGQAVALEASPDASPQVIAELATKADRLFGTDAARGNAA
jgi:hypothetical protein